MAANDARKRRLNLVYQPAFFRAAGAVFVDRLAAYLDDSLAGRTPALPWCEPQALLERARAFLRAGGEQPPEAPPLEMFERIAAEFLADANHLHAPTYMGHQVSTAVPLATLFEGLGAFANQGMAVYEMGPFSTAAERAVVETLGAYVPWPRGTFEGIGTHGGSLANLTGILAARNVRYPGCWERGVASVAGKGSRGRPAIVAGADSHYSVARAAGVLGLGTNQVLKAPLDARRRIDPDRLRALLDEASADGSDVFCLVASACTTPTGAFDPLADLADLAAERGLWLHVDGAHGASVLLSARHRHKVRGIERADTIVWDAHKMLFVPALCTFLLYRDKAHSWQAFRQDAPYLLNPEAPQMVASFDGAARTAECTKRSFAMGLFGLLAAYGPRLFEDLVDETFALTTRLWELIEAADDFEACHEPEANILCFRHVPAALRGAPEERLSAFQDQLRQRLVESGEYYVTKTRLDGRSVLRVTMMNPLSEETHLMGLLVALRRMGREIAG